MGGAGGSFWGLFVTTVSVVIRREATLAAFCKANRTTLVGSMTPASILSTYSSLSPSNPEPARGAPGVGREIFERSTFPEEAPRTGIRPGFPLNQPRRPSQRDVNH
jgi:hypothetical protein